MTRLAGLLLWIGSVIVMTIPANLIAPISILLGGRRGWEVTKANDAALNAALGGRWNEWLSTRCARAAKAGKWWGRWSCRLLDAADPGHCARALDRTH